MIGVQRNVPDVTACTAFIFNIGIGMLGIHCLFGTCGGRGGNRNLKLNSTSNILI